MVVGGRFYDFDAIIVVLCIYFLDSSFHRYRTSRHLACSGPPVHYNNARPFGFYATPTM